jgi:4-amino-4-deoxy-L-arabinose transferase-like glycosyltransferase
MIRRLLRARLATPLVLALVLAGATAVRVGLVFHTLTDDYPDYQDFVFHARQILQGHYPDRNVEGIYSFRAPLYPALMAAVARLVGERWIVVTLLQALTGVVLVGLVFAWSRRLFGERAGLVSAAMAAIYPYLLTPIGYLQTESIYTFFAFAATSLFCGAAAERAGARRRLAPAAIGAGLLLGLAMLCRPTAMLMILVLAAWSAGLLVRRAPGARRAAAAVAIAALAAAVVVLPWTARNWLRFHELIVVNNQAGEVFSLGNNHQYAMLRHARTPEEFARTLRRMWEEHAAEESAVRGLSPKQLDEHYRAKAFAYVRSAPREWAALLVDKWIDFWRPWVSPVAFGVRVAVVTAIFAVPVFALGAVGLAALARRGEIRLVALLLLVFLVHAAFFTVFHPTVRYRTPALDVFLLVLAGGGYDRLRARLAGAAPAGGGAAEARA